MVDIWIELIGCKPISAQDVLEEHALESVIVYVLLLYIAMISCMLLSLKYRDLHLLEVSFFRTHWISLILIFSTESLEDALRQSYLIDAIDESGVITSLQCTIAELPLIGVITYNCFRFMSSGMRLTTAFTGAKITTCRYVLWLKHILQYFVR